MTRPWRAQRMAYQQLVYYVVWALYGAVQLDVLLGAAGFWDVHLR